jgi:hypothetical protein
MSRAKNLNCRCRYKLPQSALGIPLVNVSGKHGPTAFNFVPICRSSGILFRMMPPLDLDGEIDTADPEYGEVWTITEDAELIFIEGDPTRPYTVKTTVNGTDPGDVIVEGRYTDVDGLVFKYDNMNPWQPHRGLTMRLIDYDTTINTVNWHDYVCLRPALNNLGNDCACDDGVERSVVVTVDIPAPGDMGNNLDNCLCTAFSGSFSFEPDNIIGFNCSGQFPVTPDCDGEFGTSSVSFLLDPVLDPITSLPLDDAALIQVLAGPGGLAWELQVERGPCDIVTNGGTFTLTNVDPTVPGCWGEEEATITFTPLTTNGEPRTAPPCGPKYCGGVSQWYLRRKCHNGLSAYYYWEPLSDVCKGECGENVCRPTEPFALVAGRVTDEDADSIGYTAQLDSLVSGGCDCDAYPADPVCADGCSVWTLRRKCYDGSSSWLYYWEPENDACTATCNDPDVCNPVPPFVIPEELLDDEEAEEFAGGDLLDLLDTEIEGSCGCVAAYVEPECPACDCDDVTANKTFTISGLTGPLAGFNGTYTLSKDEGGCSWSGTNGTINATLSWSGSWTMTLSDADTSVYTASGTACDDPIVLTLTSVAESHEGIPSEITVSEVP